MIDEVEDEQGTDRTRADETRPKTKTEKATKEERVVQEVMSALPPLSAVQQGPPVPASMRNGPVGDQVVAKRAPEDEATSQKRPRPVTVSLAGPMGQRGRQEVGLSSPLSRMLLGTLEENL